MVFITSSEMRMKRYFVNPTKDIYHKLCRCPKHKVLEATEPKNKMINGPERRINSNNSISDYGGSLKEPGGFDKAWLI